MFTRQNYFQIDAVKENGNSDTKKLVSHYTQGSNIFLRYPVGNGDISGDNLKKP
jgi:hypothetical protein